MIDSRSAGVQEMLRRMLVASSRIEDYLVPIGENRKKSNDLRQIVFLDDGNTLTMQMPQGRYRLHRNAVGQVAGKLRIPPKYLRELSESGSWQRQLAAHLLNEHSGWSDRSRVLVRVVDDEVRGILSDSYRRLDSCRILTAFLSQAQAQGAVGCAPRPEDAGCRGSAPSPDGGGRRCRRAVRPSAPPP